MKSLSLRLISPNPILNLPKLFTLYLFPVIITSLAVAYQIDPYDTIAAHIPSTGHPRILNSDDLKNLNPNNPQPLISPRGDFNQDGKEDIVISGIFDFPKGNKPYFLLVGSPFKQLFYQEYEMPIYIHLPGTTGVMDPNDQIFSISDCRDCQRGQDFYWDPKNHRFILKEWSQRLPQPVTTEEIEEVSPEIVDKALQIAGRLPDVKKFTSDLNKQGGKLVVRVKAFKNNSHWVMIFEKKGEEEILFDNILVDIKKNKVVKRSKIVE